MNTNKLNYGLAYGLIDLPAHFSACGLTNPFGHCVYGYLNGSRSLDHIIFVGKWWRLYKLFSLQRL